jgi:hypothetical protein
MCTVDEPQPVYQTILTCMECPVVTHHPCVGPQTTRQHTNHIPYQILIQLPHTAFSNIIQKQTTARCGMLCEHFSTSVPVLSASIYKSMTCTPLPCKQTDKDMTVSY